MPLIKNQLNQHINSIESHIEQQTNIKEMICSILAGYAWDEGNPYVKSSRSRLQTLATLCREI